MLTTYYTVTMQDKDESGKFMPKGNRPRSVRSFRLSTECYTAICDKAESLDISSADYLEQLYDDGVFDDDDDHDDDEQFKERLDRVLHGLLDDLYSDNQFEISSKDKAAIKRYLTTLIDDIDTVIELG